MAVLDQWEDPREGVLERFMPLTTVCTGVEALHPHPGPGWVAVLRYDSRAVPIDALDCACWLIAVSRAQELATGLGRHCFRIAREPDGCRVLLVLPVLWGWAEHLVDELNDERGGASSCGGYGTLVPMLQLAACRTVARRVWADVPLSAQIRVLNNHGLSAAFLRETWPVWLDQVWDVHDLMMLAELSQRRP